ncbi:MAG: hypothetical protein KME27_14735 [Lyngbya sp. HA4199-MV5]|jgi:uncharacterized protein YozE (UPF0346 family)|nr:hypothetical protein [Lyngbya sp. HA4199-MV5]
MQISLHTVVPAIHVEPAMMFAYPTCASDVYTPKVEQIFLPEQEDVPKLLVEIKVTKKYTWEVQVANWKWKLFEQVVKLGQHKRSLDYEGHFIFDARGETDKNIAHLLENICTPVLLAKKLLSEKLKRPVEINVVLKENASNLSKDLFSTLNIPILCTNFEVYGDVVEVIHDYSYRLYGTGAELFNFEFKNYNSSTAERVFIARRGNRHLINHHEVSKFLEEKGFVTCYFEISQQVKNGRSHATQKQLLRFMVLELATLSSIVWG